MPAMAPHLVKHLCKQPRASYPRATENLTMKLGLAIGYSEAHLDLPVALVQRAEELRYDSIWSAEAYGSDAITSLAFLAARTIASSSGPASCSWPREHRLTPPCQPPALTQWPAAAALSEG